jgi:hypothetical protein
VARPAGARPNKKQQLTGLCYLKKFDEQETQIETYQADIKKLQGTEHNQKKEFDDFFAHFTAE